MSEISIGRKRRAGRLTLYGAIGDAVMLIILGTERLQVGDTQSSASRLL